MRILLTVDFDYFIVDTAEQGRPLWPDLGKAYWKQRWQQANGNIANEVYLNGREKDFWGHLKRAFILDADAPVLVADSHEEAYWMAQAAKCDTVYSFDQHTDLGYQNVDPRKMESELLSCENWLGKLIVERKIKKARIVLPNQGDRRLLTEQKELLGYGGRWCILYKIANLRFPREADVLRTPKASVAAIMIARSGAWVPPWYDVNFRDFVSELNEVMFNR